MVAPQETNDQLLLPQLDPFTLELHQLQNTLKERENELVDALDEIKALKATEVSKTKAIEKLENDLNKVEKKLNFMEGVLEQKNFEIKSLEEEREDALAAQTAAETALRKVYAEQKDDDPFPIESIIAPLESELKMYKNEIYTLMEDKKALERLTKGKEAALVETEKILRSALERALIVEEIQNQNLELKRQIEICREENKILEKNNKQKVVEVEKLSQTINELEETILAGSAAANAARNYRRQVSELKEEKRTLERELARVKVSTNRVANVVANEWKDDNDKVMPIKMWLEERRLFQAEIQRLKDKLSVSERTAKAEAQLKDKFKLRLSTLEEGLRQVSRSQTDLKCSVKPSKTNLLGFLSNNHGPNKRSSSQPRSRSIKGSSPLHHSQLNEQPKEYNGVVESMLIRSLWPSKGKIMDSDEKENDEDNVNLPDNGGDVSDEDVVSGFMYDKLQKEVISLRKVCEAKDGNLKAKDEEIKLLTRKIEALAKSIEVQNKKSKREKAVASLKPDVQKSNRNKERTAT